MKIGEMDFTGVRIFNKDFAGNKFGPDSRQFSIEVDDPNVQEQLINLGVRLGYSKNTANGEPPRAFMNIMMDYRFGDVNVATIDEDGNYHILAQTDVDVLDKSWIESADLHINLNHWKKNNREGVTAYCKTLVVKLMSKSAVETNIKEYSSEKDGVYSKYKELFKK